jgi:hypothetical protein
MLRFFTGPSKLMEIPVECASPHALHTAKTSYLDTMVPCRNDTPALPLCFSRSKISLFIAAASEVVHDCLHRTDFRKQTGGCHYSDDSCFVCSSTHHSASSSPCCSACSGVSKYLPWIRLTSTIEPGLPATPMMPNDLSRSCIAGLSNRSDSSLHTQQSFTGTYLKILSAVNLRLYFATPFHLLI